MDEGSAIMALVKRGCSRDVRIGCILLLSKLLVVAKIIWLKGKGDSMFSSDANVLMVTVGTHQAEIVVV